MLKKLLFVVLVVSMLLAACAAPTAVPEPTKAPTKAPTVAQPEPTKVEPTANEAVVVDPNAPVMGGKVIVGTPQEPMTLNPLLSGTSVEDWTSSFIIEGLVQVDADGKYAPVLAEALPTISEDGLVVTYKLKQDVKWSNGEAFKCEDVQFTLDAILSDLSQASTSGYSAIDSIECPDDYTVVANFADVYAPYLGLFSYILPRFAGDLATLDSWEFNRMPIGTGPWIVKEWKAGDTIELAKNPNYREEGKPYLDSVIIKIVPSREVGLQLLGTGEITVLWDLVESDFPSITQLKGNGVDYAAAETGENELLLFNFGDPTKVMVEDVVADPHPILNDLKVRQALQLATDKQLIADTLLYGNVKVGTTVLPIGEFACPMAPSKYDPEAANALLDEAGWVVGTDGIREKDGLRLTLRISSTAGNQLREQTEQVLVEMYRVIGVELTIENQPSDAFFDSRMNGQFDILLYTTGPGIDPDNHLFTNYHSARIPLASNEGAGRNYSRWINATVDQLIDDAAFSTDNAARKEAYCQVAQIINDELPRVYLYERLLISGYRITLQNFQVSPGPSDLTFGSENWWLKP
ncbi:MAG TPA: ABC transporter substrate-binding protein [Anaerolineaceae bacterium]|nr:ABC transporter substrate-binding protein [Anaerolineaceae bacterium]